MYSLLRWKTFTGNLVDVLNQFKYVDQLEIIKVCTHIHTTYHPISFCKKRLTQCLRFWIPSHQVWRFLCIPPVIMSHLLCRYNAIVSTVALLVDEKKKYTNFRPVLDTYIEKQFSSIMAHKHLMSCLKHYFDEIDLNAGQISKIIPTMKVTRSDRFLTWYRPWNIYLNLSPHHEYCSTKSRPIKKMCGSRKISWMYCLPSIN